MSEREVYQCQCAECQNPGESETKELHRQMNQFLNRLNEQQRRWYVGLEAKKLGHGGTKLMSQITGMHVNTIRRGRRELENHLAGRPVPQSRLSGGGRKAVKKKCSGAPDITGVGGRGNGGAAHGWEEMDSP